MTGHLQSGCRSAIAAASLASAISVSPAAFAQERAPQHPLTPNTAINLSGNYEETVARSCSGVTQCTVTFAAVEAQTQFVVANASCSAIAGNENNPLIYMYLGTRNSSGIELVRRTYLTPINIGGPVRYVANNQLTKNYDQTEVPIIKMGVNGPSNTSFVITCTIAGAKFSP